MERSHTESPAETQAASDFLAAYQPPEPVEARNRMVEARFDLASRILASDPSPEMLDLADILTCPRGVA